MHISILFIFSTFHRLKSIAAGALFSVQKTKHRALSPHFPFLYFALMFQGPVPDMKLFSRSLLYTYALQPPLMIAVIHAPFHNLHNFPCLNEWQIIECHFTSAHLKYPAQNVNVRNMYKVAASTNVGKTQLIPYLELSSQLTAIISSIIHPQSPNHISQIIAPASQQQIIASLTMHPRPLYLSLIALLTSSAAAASLRRNIHHNNLPTECTGESCAYSQVSSFPCSGESCAYPQPSPVQPAPVWPAGASSAGGKGPLEEGVF